MSKGKSWKRELLEDVVIIAIVLGIFGGSLIGLQIYLGTPIPFLAVESGSMEPTLYRGDLVIVRAVDPATLAVGDIVIYNASSLPSPSSDVPIVHRIIEIQEVSGNLFFITKGDNNPGPDLGTRTSEDIIAKVIGSIRYLGFITLLLISPVGLYSIIALVIVFLVSSILCDNLAPRTIDEEPETSNATS